MGKKRRKRQNEDSKESSFGSFRMGTSSSEEKTFDGKLVVLSVEASGCDVYARSLRSDWEDVVFLHPNVMRENGIQELVLIHGEGKSILCVAHPVGTLKESVIVFPKGSTLFAFNEHVTLEKYESEVEIAEEIFIAFNGENLASHDNTRRYILRLLCNRFVYENLNFQFKLFNRDYQCAVKRVTNSSNASKLDSCSSSSPKFYTVSNKTSLKVIENLDSKSCVFEIGGLEKEKKIIRNYLQKFLSGSVYCEILMLKGPSGTGKSLLLDNILKEFAVHREYILWYKLCSMSSVEVQKTLKDTFQRAADKVPSVIVMEDFDYLCPDKSTAETIHQHIARYLSQGAKLMVIATTNNSDCDTSVLQQSGRMMEVVKFQIPTTDERVCILNKLLKNFRHELTDDHIQKCAGFAHGFTGKDLLEAVDDAQMIATEREYTGELDTRNTNHLVDTIKYHDLHFCIKLRKKFIVSTSDVNVKKVQWSDIGGMTSVKEKLKQIVEWPLRHPEAFKNFNITPSRGVLMYGPPGCSKTMIAKALATECELNFISKNAADLYDKYVGESEKAVRDLFVLAKAKSPCIIFLDEIDALVTERESSSGSSGVGNRIVTTLLTEMDGVEELHGVIIIAATNRPDMLDDALVRNGRINHFIYVPLPDAATREEILKISMRKRCISEDFDFRILSEKTEGYSGAEIVNLCNEAAVQLLMEDPKSEFPVFKFEHFEKVLSYVQPRTSKEMVEFYEAFNSKHCT